MPLSVKSPSRALISLQTGPKQELKFLQTLARAAAAHGWTCEASGRCECTSWLAKAEWQIVAHSSAHVNEMHNKIHENK